MNLSFVIRGNQEDTSGNPLGYHRTTQGSYWNAGSRRYAAWKDYVVSEFERGTQRKPKQGKPLTIAKNEAAQVSMRIFWHNKAHADIDNVLKGILDALFVDDKGINGISATSEPAKDGKGKVEIDITL